jgi:hypothetical protein
MSEISPAPTCRTSTLLFNEPFNIVTGKPPLLPADILHQRDLALPYSAFRCRLTDAKQLRRFAERRNLNAADYQRHFAEIRLRQNHWIPDAIRHRQQ